jgi:hypothetical protein
MRVQCSALNEWIARHTGTLVAVGSSPCLIDNEGFRPLAWAQGVGYCSPI